MARQGYGQFGTPDNRPASPVVRIDDLVAALQVISSRGVAGPVSNVNEPDKQYVEDWYIYELDVLALAAAGVFNGNIQIDATSDFKLSKLSMTTDLAGAAQTESTRVIPLCTIQIVDGGSGRQLFSSGVSLNSLFGTGPLPYILPVPRIFKMRSTILVNVTNYSAATTYNIRLAFQGAKLFTSGGLQSP